MRTYTHISLDAALKKFICKRDKETYQRTPPIHNCELCQESKRRYKNHNWLTKILHKYWI